jgi:hypothetical protein
MSNSPNPPMPSPAQLGVLLGQTLTAIANAQNSAAILIYQKAVTLYYKSYGSSPIPSAPAPPVPPKIVTVNTTLVESLELANVGSITPEQWLSIYSYTTYPVIGPPAPAPVTLPTIVIQPFGPGFPNYFELSPDGPQIPVGQEVTIAGVKYVKLVVAQSPFGPNGVITAWLQV